MSAELQDMLPDEYTLVAPDGRKARYVKETPAWRDPDPAYIELATKLLTHPDVIKALAIQIMEEGL